MESKPLVAAGFIIYRMFQNSRQYLLLQASYGDKHWTPPKGHMDPGENEFKTAIRETEEEAGLKREDYDVIENFKKELNYEVKGRLKRVIYWVAKIKDGKSIVLSHEHQDFKWLNLNEAIKFAKFANLQDTLRSLDEFLEKN